MSETEKKNREIEKLQKQYKKLTDLMKTLYSKHVNPILDYMKDEYFKNLSDVENEIETINKQIMKLIDKREKAYNKQGRLLEKDIDSIIGKTKEILLVSKETKNKYTQNLKILNEKRDQLRFKIHRLTTGKKLEKESDSNSPLNVSVSPPRKKSATRKKSASPAGKKSSPSRNSKTSKRR